MATQIEMPAMGESVTEGTVLEWHVAEGDYVEEGATVVEVSTDKVDAEVPAPVSGTITKIFKAADEDVQVGEVLAEIDPAATAPAAGASTASDGAGEAASGGGEAAAIVEITMPEMGESVTEGTVLEYRVAVGQAVAEGDVIVEVSTDKVDAEVPAPSDGTITELTLQEDDTVKVGAVLARMSGAGAAAVAASSAAASAAPNTSAVAASDPSTKATPLARRIAADKGVAVGALSGSGFAGKVTKADVTAAVLSGAAKPADTVVPKGAALRRLKGPAASLVKAMEQSLATPTATSFRNLAVDTLDAKRRALNETLKPRAVKLSFTHLVAWAIVSAVREQRVMVREFAIADGKPHAVENDDVNLGIAVDMERRDGSRGLMVPVIKAADKLDFKGFHAYYEDLISKTRDSSMTAEDLIGANITLTNPGGIGTVASVPRLTTGGSIIATGSIAHPIEWSHASPEKLRTLGVSKVMTMTSTYDHRVIQGAESGAFLKRVDQFLQGEENFYEAIAESLGVDPKAVTQAHAAAASAPPLAGLATAVGQVAPTAAPRTELLQAVQAATSLLKAYRTHGHLAARLDPLGTKPKGDPALEPETLDLTPELMAQIPASILRIGVPGENLLDALPRMRGAYCGTIGYQIEHLSSHQQRMWLRDMIETDAHRGTLDGVEKKELLRRLIEVFQFERFLQKAYLGQKMFSIEGLDAVVPMLDEIATLAERGGATEVVIGMAHRGRLSVLAHNLGRSIESILSEFEAAKEIDAVRNTAAIKHGGTGDVKYHHGAEGILSTRHGSQVKMRLSPNPSHLEFVDPVVTGIARAEQSDHSGPQLHHDTRIAVGVLLHGDAAFPGQGVVAETFNLQALRGYATGGTIHIITNNQVGFTTDPQEGRSTPYAADMAKGFNVPIVHVNADDVEACVAAVRLAIAYRDKWGRDFVIDLIGYRRYGHNETDEPAYTQPLMAAKVKKHPPVSEVYAGELVKQGVVTTDEVAAAAATRLAEISTIHKELRAKIDAGEFEDPTLTQAGTGELDRTKSPEVDTAVSGKRVRGLNAELLRVPDSFAIHKKLQKPLMRRLEVLEDGPIEFGHAEGLAYASLLTEGTHIRLTGQDVERGTFSHRHVVLNDAKTGLKYSPMQHLSGALAPFEIHNSPLSEIACLGFEYGYSAASPESLILWEAQFGDFGNSAQVIIDSFIVSGEAKWDQKSRLTMLLPHGYEGSGPEHSSARIERFIQLAAEGNIRLANPTTAAQYFHLLRRQARIAKQRPLIVFTPKGLLRLPAAASKLSDLTEGRFHFVLDDAAAAERREQISRLVLCSGKVFYDIESNEARAVHPEVAIARVELLYPFAKTELRQLVAAYPNLTEIVWVQEEPKNMGGWSVMSRRMPELVPEGVEFRYIGRPERASPSEGYGSAHRLEQERIVLTALAG